MAGRCELEHIAKAICDKGGFSYVQFIDAGAFKETFQIYDGKKNHSLKVFKANNHHERTAREIDAMRRASCNNVAKLLMVDNIIHNHDTYLYLIEEFLSGGSLGTLLEKSTISRNELLNLGNDLICALEATYRERIVHRDIKPDNIMFRGNRNDAVLVDFGLVRDLEATSLTQAFHMRGPGTPLYSAPEQLNNQKAMIDWRTDQFALGITLCEAILGEHPFCAGNSIKTVEKIASLKKCNDVTIKKIADLGLEPLLKMLEPYPIGRYRTPSLLKNAWSKMEV